MSGKAEPALSNKLDDGASNKVSKKDLDDAADSIMTKGVSEQLSRDHQTSSEALESAIINRDIDQVQVLLEAGIDPNEPFEAYTSPNRGYGVPKKVPLRVACGKCDIQMVRLLLRYGADAYAGEINWESPAAKAIAAVSHDQPDRLELVREILDFNPARTREMMEDILKVTIMFDKPDILEILIKNWVDKDIVLDGKWFGSRTLLEEALYNTKILTFKLLLDHGADPNRTGSPDGVTPLMRAIRWKPSWVQRLLRHGADATLINQNNVTAFDYACSILAVPSALEITKHVYRSEERMSKITARRSPLDFLTCSEGLLGGEDMYRFEGIFKIACLIVWAEDLSVGMNLQPLSKAITMVWSRLRDGDTGPRNLHKVLETLIMTRAISRKEVSRLCAEIHPLDERSEELVQGFLKSGYTLKQMCRLKLRSVIRPPLRASVLSDGLPLPKLLKEYITGGEVHGEYLYREATVDG